jgi:hypothetical protein
MVGFAVVGTHRLASRLVCVTGLLRARPRMQTDRPVVRGRNVQSRHWARRRRARPLLQGRPTRNGARSEQEH